MEEKKIKKIAKRYGGAQSMFYIGRKYNYAIALEGALKIKEIENNKGTVLPETGGIGTTLFITLGALAVIGTGLFLVTNKRISKENF